MRRASPRRAFEPSLRRLRPMSSLQSWGEDRKKQEPEMTPDQVNLVQQSFAKVVPISDAAAVLFYDRLFEIAPQVKAMFPSSIIAISASM